MFVARRRGTEHAETHQGLEYEMVVSCGSGEQPMENEVGFGFLQP